MTQPILTDDQRLLLHDLTVKKDMTPGWTFEQIAAVRTELLGLGLLGLDGGWIVVTDEGLRALDTPGARRILRARANA